MKKLLGTGILLILAAFLLPSSHAIAGNFSSVMVTGTNTAYRCKECGALFLQNKNGTILVFPEEPEKTTAFEGGKPSKLVVMLKKFLGFVTCPQCGSGKVIKDESILT